PPPPPRRPRGGRLAGRDGPPGPARLRRLARPLARGRRPIRRGDGLRPPRSPRPGDRPGGRRERTARLRRGRLVDRRRFGLLAARLRGGPLGRRADRREGWEPR